MESELRVCTNNPYTKPRKRVEKLVSTFYETFDKGDYLRFIDYVFPVYVALRTERYNHYPDLTI